MSGIQRHNDLFGPVQVASGASALTTEAYRDTSFLMPFLDMIKMIFYFLHSKFRTIKHLELI
jgi:hypothetical protein